MSILYGALTAIVLVLIVFVMVVSSGFMRRSNATTPRTNTGVPSVYAVRSVDRYIRKKSIKPRLMMWGIGLFAVAGGIALISPKMFLENIVRFGPAILCALIGFAVIGFGNSMEEEYESYEYSRLGWGIGLTMFLLGAVAFFK